MPYGKKDLSSRRLQIDALTCRQLHQGELAGLTLVSSWLGFSPRTDYSTIGIITITGCGHTSASFPTC